MSSCVDFDLHAHEVVGAGLAILAVYAVTFLSTLYSRSVALTVVFDAARLLAGTLSFWHKGGYAFKSPWVTEICYLTSSIYL